MISLRKDRLDWLAVSILLVCCMTWGAQQVLTKATLAEVPPVFQACLRFAGSTVFLWLWCQWRGIKLFERDGSLKWGIISALLFSSEFAAMNLGLQHTTASRLTLFVYTSPFVVALVLPLFVPAEKLRKLHWLGFAIAFIGVGLALSEGLSVSQNGVSSLRGDLLGLYAGMMWGLTTVVIRTTGLTLISPEKLLFYQVAISTFTLGAFSAWRGESWAVAHYSSFAWGSVLIQGLVISFLSYLAWMWMLGRYPATKISVFVFLTPVFALLFGSLFLQESISSILLLALACVAVGIVIVNRK